MKISCTSRNMLKVCLRKARSERPTDDGGAKQSSVKRCCCVWHETCIHLHIFNLWKS